jgi:glycerophosphoryl diester phosphodiesterase
MSERKRLRRVGHKGADLIAPGNTYASFDAALAAGVDMIEFDVLPARGGIRTLYVAHDYGALDPHRSLTLEQALSHFASTPYAGIRLQLDIKRRGYEREVLAALGATGTRERAFISTGVRGVLPRFRELAPDLWLGWTVPDIPMIGSTPVIGGLWAARIPARAAARIGEGAIDALVPHHSLVTAALVEAVRGAGGELYAWTVDDAAEIGRLAALGVTGVITNDPRLFAVIVQSEEL